MKNLNKKRFSLLGILLAVCLAGVAAPVGRQTALQTARQFLGEHGRTLGNVVRKAPGTAADSEAAPYYVFNTADGNGFVVVSGDDQTVPVLGYVDGAAFDEARLPSNMRAWLQGYADQISALQRRETAAVALSSARSPRRVPVHQAVAPLLTTQWDQGTNEGDAYNHFCPKYSGSYCPTGCVATAMAQVMNYHQWPKAATTSLPAYTTYTRKLKVSALPAIVFDWDNMQDVYYGNESEAQYDAVGRLMQYCGSSVAMDYDLMGSGAMSDDVAAALRTNFGYDENLRYLDRDDYSVEAWDALIYNELANRRPVYYSGVSTGGGHAFVCDGYDGAGFYHINWGWGGMLNGYFKLTILEPGGGGTGGSSTEDGFSVMQDAVVGVQPPTAMSQKGNEMTFYAPFEVEKNYLYAYFINETAGTLTYEVGFKAEKVGTTTSNITSETMSLSPDNYDYTYLRLSSLSDGTWRIYPVSRPQGTEEWRVHGDGTQYAEVTVSGGSVQNVVIHPLTNLGCTNVDFPGNKVAGSSQEVRVALNNAGDEYHGIVFLFANKASYKGSAVCMTGVSLEAGETEDLSLYFTPAASGKWNIWVTEDQGGNQVLYKTSVDIISAPTGKTQLSLGDCQVETGTTTTITASVKNTGSVAYYRPLTAYLFDASGNQLLNVSATGNMSLGGGEAQSVVFRFEGLRQGETYQLGLYHYESYQSDELIPLQEGIVVKVGGDGGGEKPVTLTANSYTRTYGAANPAFAYMKTGEGVLIGKPELTCEADETSPVGTYPIRIARGTVSNTLATFVEGTLTVEPAELTVAVSDATIMQGEPLPEFLLTYEGFVNGEDASVILVLPTVTTTATAASEPGTYPVEVSGGEAANYVLSYRGATLTILPSPTGIRGLQTTSGWTVPVDIYSLTGVLIRRQATSTNGLPAGVYVVNGRKMVVKR